MNVNTPSLDAANHYEPLLAAAQEQASRQADDIAAADAAEKAIKAISELNFTPAVAARIQVVLRNRVARSEWHHFKHVDAAIGLMDDAHDTLGVV